MAYKLKDTGLATRVISCVLVDDDGETIVDLAAETQVLVRHSAVTIGEKAWKGTVRKFFETKVSGINVYGLSWPTGQRPAVPTDTAAGVAVFVAYAGMSPGTGGNYQVDVNIGTTAVSGASPSSSGFKFNEGGAQFEIGVSTSAVGDTPVPTNGNTSFSAGANWRVGAVHEEASSQPFFGLESGSIAADGEDSKPGNYGKAETALWAIGGRDTYGGQPAKRHCVVVIEGKLTLSEWQSLHNDWFGVLIQNTANLPAAPTNPTVTGVSGNSATFGWTDNATNETGYEVQYRNVTNSGAWIEVGSFPANTTSATKSDFSPAGHTFQVRSRAVGTGGGSAWLTSPTFVIPGASGSPTIDITPTTLSVESGADGILKIQRSAAAGAGGIVYNLASSTPAVASVPATVQLLQGLSEVSFPVSGAGIGGATITATNSANSSETDSASVSVVAMRKLKVLAHSDAQNAHSVVGMVYRASGGYTGEPIGEFSGATFEAVIQGDRAVLKVPLMLIEGSDELDVDDELICSWEGLAKAKTGSAFAENAQIGSSGRGSPATVIAE